jgi:hypothetical protein
MKWLFIILLPMLAIVGNSHAHVLHFSEHYPANGATGVPADTTIWFKVYTSIDSPYAIKTRPSEDSPSPLWTLSIVGDLDTVQQLDTITTDRWSLDIVDDGGGTMDCVIITPLTNFKNYFKIWVKVYGEPSFTGADSFYFMTDGAVNPFNVRQIATGAILDTTETGSRVVTVFRPAGSTVYGLLGATEFVLASPSTDYDTEWTWLRSSYTITGLPQGMNRIYFWCESPEGAVSDTVSQLFFYKRHNLRTSQDWWYRR